MGSSVHCLLITTSPGALVHQHFGLWIMGRSNGCEANRKRAEAAKRAEKYSKEGNSQLKKNDAAQTLICAICKQTFMCTQAKMLPLHQESRHAKNSFEECFPGIEKP